MLVGLDRMLIVGLGEIRVVKDREVVLTCVGLGSCVALCAWDSTARVGGMAHFFLASGDALHAGSPGKFADTGVPSLLKEMTGMGASIHRLAIKMAGGAQMLAVPGADTRLSVGVKNVAAVRKALRQEGLPIQAEDVGGRWGRQVQLFVDTGAVVVKTVGQGTREL